MRGWRTLLIAAALAGSASAASVSTVSAQAGVYEDDTDGYFGERRGGGVRISGQARAAIIPPVYTVRRGDTLWDVTGRFYGNPWEWPRIWSYNPEVTNPHWIYPLDQLRLRAEGDIQTAPVSGSQLRAPVHAMQEGTVFLRQEGYLDDEALDEAGVVAGSPEDHMLLAPYDQVYIQFGDEHTGRPTGEYTIFGEVDDRHREADGEGTLVRIYGAVRIESYDEESHRARATIIEALDPIERGHRVAPVPRRFDMVPPAVADRDLETHVAATLRPRALLGAQQVVFVPVGTEEGVQVGNRFVIVVSGDRWRDGLAAGADGVGSEVDAPDEPDEYPDEIVAEGRVVHVRPHSATLVLTRSLREVERGDRAELRQGY